MVLMVLSALGENSYIRKQQKSSFVFSAWVLLSFIQIRDMLKHMNLEEMKQKQKYQK